MLANKDNRLVNELIAICHDGQRFYRQAAAEVTDSDLKSLFREMASIRAEIAEDLTKKVEEKGGSPEIGGSLVGKMRTVYTDVSTQLSDDANYHFVIELEASEEVTLNIFRDDIRKVDSPHLANDIARHLATIQVTHDRMKDIKDSLTAVKH
ncbi:PA2169 family four-helix-bundle protein [Neptunomonas sp.]|uniref:PA2169 family four-helix-bundle protein n=1 Tax=Neptunomonas TaxID=75687 RepID=UPI0035149215